MCLPPRQLAEALLFLRKAPAVKNVVKLHLQAPVWARLRLGKTLSTSELQILAHCYSQESTVGKRKEQIPGTTPGHVANACGCQLGHLRKAVAA